MERDDLMLLAQLLKTMKELVDKLESYYNKKDLENVESTKKEILALKKKIDGLL